MRDTPEERESAVFSAIAQRNRAEKAERERDEALAHLERRDEFLDTIYRRLGGEPDKRVATVDYPIIEEITKAEATIGRCEALAMEWREAIADAAGLDNGLLRLNVTELEAALREPEEGIEAGGQQFKPDEWPNVTTPAKTEES